MTTCPICQKPIALNRQTEFVVKAVAYHEECIPHCENCGKPIPFERTCASISAERKDNEIVRWKARHKRCY